ncbi:hypothetical protein H2200_009682 [Cladophialophora chaetospira]|uniref:NmrA-like domain-containing protein n=1 Tax=Cladophialophora chaetospira TaxID=386627 RepID=A0AA38X346_9EURO|nr:hypothetical protein H2200_009682 [Cladophialophora chaetospira]
MSSQTVLVIGGSGAQGIPIVQELSRHPEHYSEVRVLTRDPESTNCKLLLELPRVKLSIGATDDDEDLRRALRGIDLVFCNFNSFIFGIKNETYWGIRIYQLSAQAGVKHFIWSSLDNFGYETNFDDTMRPGHYYGKAQVEQWLYSIPQREDRTRWSILTTGPYVEMLWELFCPKQDSDGTFVFQMPFEGWSHPFRLNLKVAIEHVPLELIPSTFSKLTGKPARAENLTLEEYFKVGGFAAVADTKIASQAAGPDDKTLLTYRQNFSSWFNLLGQDLYDTALVYPEDGTQADGNVSKVPSLNSTGRTRKRSKLRSSSTTDPSDESAIERRRTQVRLAQRAYRNREKNLVSSLQKDVDELKGHLRGMQTISDNCFEFVSSLPTLSSDHKRKLWSLRTSEASYRLPDSSTSIEAEPETTTRVSPLGSRFPTDQVVVSHQLSPSSFADSSPGLVLDGRTIKRSSASSRRDAPQNLSPSLRILFGSSQDVPYRQLDFSVRLRIDALKGAHRLIATSDTPYATLLDVFRHCIFVSTRQEIIARLEILIRESSGVDGLPRPALVADKASEQFPPLIYPENVEGDDELGGKADPYIDPDGIRHYLSAKGLNVDSMAAYAEFSPPSKESDTQSQTRRTIFEEVCHSQKVRINITKLHRELLSRMVCRWVGPGILASKIDEALQSTLLASSN